LSQDLPKRRLRGRSTAGRSASKRPLRGRSIGLDAIAGFVAVAGRVGDQSVATGEMASAGERRPTVAIATATPVVAVTIRPIITAP
jgi:hypothetical protein